MTNATFLRQRQGPLGWLLGWIDDYFFGADRPDALCISRMIFCGSLFLYYTLAEDYRGWHTIGGTFYEPTGLYHLLYQATGVVPTVSDGWTLVLQWLWRGSLLLAAVGLFTRPSLWVAVIGAVYFLGLKASFGKVSHSEPTVVFVLLTLAMSRCNVAWSLDRRLGLVASAGPSGHFRWPVRTVWIMVAIVFTAAGVQKLYFAGFAWASPESFTPMMMQHFYTNDPPTDIALTLMWFAPFVWFGGLATLLGESLFPLALINWRARLVLVPLMFGMQMNIAILFGVYFWQFLPAYAFFVPWDWLLARRRRTMESA